MQWIEKLKQKTKAAADALRSLLLPNREPQPELAPVRVPAGNSSRRR